jgi:hypothetical protein
MKTLETLVVPMDLPLPTLLAIRENLPPPPTLADLRVGLETDRALLLRTAQFLESLPPGTSAAAGLTRWLGARAAVGWNLNHSGRFAQARDLAADLSRQASALEHLVQKTFLAGPAWRQWLSANPAAGLPPLLTDGLDGFRFFEQTRSDYQLARAALEVRLALQTTGADAARKIPDPLVPGSFLQIEVSEDRLTTFGSSLPASADVPPRFRLPDSLRSALNLAAEKTSPDVPGR